MNKTFKFQEGEDDQSSLGSKISSPNLGAPKCTSTQSEKRSIASTSNWAVNKREKGKVQFEETRKQSQGFQY